ncbi:ankyrin repeat domain-containing protein 39 [Danaus plexippus]|uniref:ankyrin repeat domain-containing protein 39 n=1 Tax=Danaus plexippus TaxID=13037 RepID=UPI002AB2288D|nr:ankyrin repeat domain-containing protein 39 [Danaus plexippus]
MDHKCNLINHSTCCVSSANKSVQQTLSEMDWERSIWNAAFTGDQKRVQSLLDKSNNPKELVNSLDNSGYTALHYAARSGHLNICKLLLDHGAYINAQTRSGKATPLHKAACSGKKNIIMFLINNGAQIDLQDSDGKTVLHRVTENKQVDLISTLLEACPKLKDIKDNRGNLAI